MERDCFSLHPTGGQKVLNNCYQEKMFRETFYGQGCTRRGEGLLGTVHEQKKNRESRIIDVKILFS